MTNEAPANIVIRDLEDKDLPIIQSIYAGQVLHGVSSWEETPLGLAEMTKRQDGIVNVGYPYRIPVRDDEVIWYSCASAYRPRPAIALPLKI